MEVFYRVDYIVAVMLVGIGLGALLSKSFARISSWRLARGYYLLVMVLVVLRASVNIVGILGSRARPWSTVSGCIGDVLGLTSGVLLGLAIRRQDPRSFLTSNSILDAKCASIAFSFALVGAGKAFGMVPMTEFFVQSGYSVTFLKFIIVAEIFGAIGVLVPWAVIPALAGLAVDMFGALVTHIHNGDPLNDSTGAIGSLINILILGGLLALRQRNGFARLTLRGALLKTTAFALACLLFAMVGSNGVRHYVASAKEHEPALNSGSGH